MNMLTQKSKENLKLFKALMIAPVDDPRKWIEDQVRRHRPDCNYPEVIDQLMVHLNDFLSIDEVYDNLDMGGEYSCDAVFEEIVSKWRFQYSSNSFSTLILWLFPDTREEDANKWSPPQT